MTVTRSLYPSFAISVLLLHHHKRTRSHLLPLFHTSLAIFFTEQDLRLIGAPHQLQKCYANVPVVCEKWRGGEAYLSKTLIHHCTSFLLKGKLFPFETSLAKWIWISLEKNTSRAKRWSGKQSWINLSYGNGKKNNPWNKVCFHVSV